MDKYWEMMRELDMAQIERHCPRKEVFESNKLEDTLHLAKHMAKCDHCQMLSDDEKASWAEFGRTLKKLWNLPDWVKSSHPFPGQVWSLNPDLSQWKNDSGLRLNAPLVMVIEVYEDVKGVRVAQLHDYGHLTGPDEIECKMGYVETWNTYTVRYEDLYAQYPETFEGTAALVRLGKFPSEFKSAGKELIEDFREMEIEISSCMALQAIGDLIERDESLE